MAVSMIAIRNAARSPITFPVCAVAVALWPIWPWYYTVITSPWGEPWGLLALVTAVAFLAIGPERAEGSVTEQTPPWLHTQQWLIIPGIALLVYACTYPFLSPLLRGTDAFIALSCLLGAWRFGRALHPGLLGLMLLALPIIPPLQFYIGYPLRLLTAFVSSRLLALNGLAVNAVGTCLDWNGTLVAVDAPCSGVRMLWTGLYLAMMLACFLRLSMLRTIAFTCVAVAVVIAGNVLRTSTLFYIESDILAAPAWAHEGVGGAAFLIVAAAIAGTAHYMQRRNVCSAV